MNLDRGRSVTKTKQKNCIRGKSFALGAKKSLSVSVLREDTMAGRQTGVLRRLITLSVSHISRPAAGVTLGTRTTAFKTDLREMLRPRLT